MSIYSLRRAPIYRRLPISSLLINFGLAKCDGPLPRAGFPMLSLDMGHEDRMETLVHALRDRDEDRQSILREFLTPSSFIETRPVSLEIIEDALLLRVNFGLKSPDAIHVATGVSANCSAFLTKDEKWGKLNLSILTASDLVWWLSDSC